MVLLLAVLACALDRPTSAAPPSDEPPQGVLNLPKDCVPGPPIGQLVHVQCGETRAIVAQVKTLDTPLHDAIVESLLDVVPSPQRLVATPQPGELARTVWEQQRNDLEREDASVRLTVTSRVSTGQTVACIQAIDGRRRTRHEERDWCAAMVQRLAPLPARPEVAHTTIEVVGPDLPPDDLPAQPGWRRR